MAKGGVYGISTVTLADCVAGSFPSAFNGYSFKAIVKDSVQFNDSAASKNDIEIEDSDNPYASLPSSLATKGFTMDTYDLSAETYAALLGYTTSDNWNVEPVGTVNLVKAVQIVTKEYDKFPSKTFQWAKMDIAVTKAGTVGKSGFPNLHLEFKQLANMDDNGEEQPGARWANTDALSA